MRPAKKDPQSPSLPLVKQQRKVENITTLKRVCPSECQEAQDAFKDSMIH